MGHAIVWAADLQILPPKYMEYAPSGAVRLCMYSRIQITSAEHGAVQC